MIVDELIEKLELPKNPVEIGKGKSWGAITSKFGKTLPTDYMAFIDRYGSGEIGGWLTVLNPFSSNPSISLVDQFFVVLGSLNYLKEKYPDDFPYPLMFEPGGLLPWGFSIDGDIYCWLTNGMSGKWPVVVIGRHSEPEKYDMPMSRFLSKCIAGEINPKSIPQEWTEQEVKFVPYEL